MFPYHVIVVKSSCILLLLTGRFFSLFWNFQFCLQCFILFLVFLLLPVHFGSFRRVVLFVLHVLIFFSSQFVLASSSGLSFSLDVANFLSAFPVEFPIQILCFCSCSLLEHWSVWFGWVVFGLFLRCGSLTLESYCFSVFCVSIINLRSFCLDTLFILGCISNISRSEKLPFCIIVLTWSASLSTVVRNLVPPSQISLISFKIHLNVESLLK